jgi:hypothetical protein
MKIDILDIPKLIKINGMQEVEEYKIFKRKTTYNDKGLLSQTIFGYSIQDRKEFFAYIDLKGYYFHPQIYNQFAKSLRIIPTIIAGGVNVSIKDGRLIKNTNGWTGIQELYKHWDEIKKITDSDDSDTNQILEILDRSDVFLNKFPVIPAFFRDIDIDANSNVTTTEINQMYSDIIRIADYIETTVQTFDMTLFNSQSTIQQRLVDIDDYFNQRIAKKRGIIQSSLLAKQVDYGTRSVISAPIYTGKANNKTVKYDSSYLPLAQTCVGLYPFVLKYCMDYFKNVALEYTVPTKFLPKGKNKVDYVIHNPELQYDQQFCAKLIDRFVKNSSSRFDIIKIKLRDINTDEIMELSLTENRMIKDSETGPETYQKDIPVTISDILYRAASDAAIGRYNYSTRYPYLDIYGKFVAKLVVESTKTYFHIWINGIEYERYPKIEFDIPKSKVPGKFIDTYKFSNSRLKAMVGDYDGDMLSNRIPYSIEAIEDSKDLCEGKLDKLGLDGKTCRVISSEFTLALYCLTKNEGSNELSSSVKSYILDAEPTYFDNGLLADLFTERVDITDGKFDKKKPKCNPEDIMDYNGKKTTVGRYVYNKFVLIGSGLEGKVPYQNIVLDGDGVKKVDQLVSDLLTQDKIGHTEMSNYLTNRDALAAMLVPMITPSLTKNLMTFNGKAKSKKAALVKQYQDRIDKGDIVAMNIIENELIAFAKEELQNDPAMDLFNTGEGANFNNNFKVNYLTRGPIMNKETGKFEFIKGSLSDGINKDELSGWGNSITAGVYPGAIGTMESGYQSKKFNATMQYEHLEPKGSNCGTKKTLKKKVTTALASEYRYFVEGGKIKQLNPDNVSSYMGQTLNFRSPLYNVSDGICNICAGDYFYNMGVVNVGLVMSKLSGVLLNALTKSKHDLTIRLFNITESMLN